MSGEVVYADHFGNLITNIPGEALANSPKVEIQVAGRTIHGLNLTFHEDHVATDTGSSQALIALVGSLGYLEITVPDGNAAAALSAGPGEPVSVSFA